MPADNAVRSAKRVVDGVPAHSTEEEPPVVLAKANLREVKAE